MRRLPIVLLVALPLAGCGLFGPSDRVTRLNELVGQPPAEVIRVMGEPSTSAVINGHEYITYKRHTLEEQFAGYDIDAGYGRYGGLGFRKLGFEAAPSLYIKACETVFEIAQHKVKGYSLQGNDCL